MATVQYTRKLGDTIHLYAVWKQAPHQHFKVYDRYGFLFPDAEPALHTQWRPSKKFLGVRHAVHARDAIADALDVDVNLVKAPLWKRPQHEGYVALCPHASRPDKEWHNSAWTILMRRLDEQGLPYRYLPAHGRGGKIELPELIETLSKARVVIGVDSGPLHVADAYDIPAIGLFGPTSPVCYGPYRSQHLAIDHHPHPENTGMWCKDGHAIMQSISVSEVMAKLDEALKL